MGVHVERVTRGRLNASSLCHCDPMFENGRCAFGQTGAAQTHLQNNGVEIGDVFLFFGLFAEESSGERHHRIFGYLKVEEVIRPGPTPTQKDQPQGFSIRHPHTIGHWNTNNTIYVGPGNTACMDSPKLRLTVPGGPVSHWRIPSWLFDTGLSYHRKSSRWGSDGTLKAVARGQEFVADISESAEAEVWLNQTLELIQDTTREY